MMDSDQWQYRSCQVRLLKVLLMARGGRTWLSQTDSFSLTNSSPYSHKFSEPFVKSPN